MPGGLEIIIAPPSINIDALNAADHEVIIPAFALPTLRLEASYWAYAKGTPSNVSSGFDFKNATESNMSGASIDKYGTGVDYLGGKFLLAFARPIASPAAPMVGNTVVISNGSTELGRFFINAADQESSYILLVTPANTEDNRFNLNGTNDLNIALTTVDANMQVHIFMGAND